MRDPAANPKPYPTADRTPALQFLAARLNGVPLKRMLEEYQRAMVALVASDIPLDPRFRRDLAVELEFLYFESTPTQARKKKRREEAIRFAVCVKRLKSALRERNKTLSAIDAEEAVADLYHVSVEALRKRLQRVR
jgi:hypothetical protein